MPQPPVQEMKYDKIAVGATRPSVVKYFDIPMGFLPVVMIPPLVIGWITFNPFWLLVGWPALVLICRRVVKNDHNRPRVLWLAFISGAMFAERAAWGGRTVDPLSNGDNYYYER